MKIVQRYQESISKLNNYNDYIQLYNKFQNELNGENILSLSKEYFQKKQNNILMNLFVFRIFVQSCLDNKIFEDKNLIRTLIKLTFVRELIRYNDSQQSQSKLYQLSLIQIFLQVYKIDRQFISEIPLCFQFLLNYLQNQKITNSQISFENLYENTFFHKKQDNVSLMYFTIKTLKQFMTNTNSNSNYEKIFQTNIKQLKRINSNNDKINNLIQSVIQVYDQSFSEYLSKPPLQILKEESAIKVKQLTPRLENSELQDKLYQKKKLQKKVKKLNKQIIKDVRSDQQIVNQSQQIQEERRKNNNKQAFKQYKAKLMDSYEQVKKLKTMQIKIDRNKKKGKRLGGKKE